MFLVIAYNYIWAALSLNSQLRLKTFLSSIIFLIADTIRYVCYDYTLSACKISSLSCKANFAIISHVNEGDNSKCDVQLSKRHVKRLNSYKSTHELQWRLALDLQSLLDTKSALVLQMMVLCMTVFGTCTVCVCVQGITWRTLGKRRRAYDEVLSLRSDSHWALM